MEEGFKCFPTETFRSTTENLHRRETRELDATVKYGEEMCQAPLLVVSGSGPSLFGRNWLERIKLDWGSIQKIETTADQLLQEYAEVFRKELGTVQGVQARLEVKEGAVPRFHKPRSVPYAIRSAIEQDLERLENHWEGPIQ